MAKIFSTAFLSLYHTILAGRKSLLVVSRNVAPSEFLDDEPEYSHPSCRDALIRTPQSQLCDSCEEQQNTATW